MNGKDYREKDEIFSKVVRAGRRTYFFDVRSTKADDYYLTITESKKFTNDDGSFHYKKHKIYLYKEDFAEFQETLNEICQFIIDKKGEDVITDHKPKGDVKDTSINQKSDQPSEPNHPSSFTDVNFEDL
jgi:hypothetical protein